MIKFNLARKKEVTSSQKGKPLKRVAPMWRERISISGLVAVLLIGSGSVGVWSWNNGSKISSVDFKSA